MNTLENIILKKIINSDVIFSDDIEVRVALKLNHTHQKCVSDVIESLEKQGALTIESNIYSQPYLKVTDYGMTFRDK